MRSYVLIPQSGVDTETYVKRIVAIYMSQLVLFNFVTSLLAKVRGAYIRTLTDQSFKLHVPNVPVS